MHIEELPLLVQLFNYADVDAMITDNTKAILNKDISIFVLYVDNKLIGELHVKYKSEDVLQAILNQRAYLFAYRIHKNYQGSGWGKLLLTTVINILEKEGYKEFTVGVEDDNLLAKHIYAVHGFTEVIERKIENYQGGSYEYNLLLRK
jgi:ribosomal protein S18 acetylase RimI-like enzyme